MMLKSSELIDSRFQQFRAVINSSVFSLIARALLSAKSSVPTLIAAR